MTRALITVGSAVNEQEVLSSEQLHFVGDVGSLKRKQTGV